MRRRLHLVPFTVTIPAARRDPQLVEKLRVERDGILRWMMEGCADWQCIDLAPPDCVLEALRSTSKIKTWSGSGSQKNVPRARNSAPHPNCDSPVGSPGPKKQGTRLGPPNPWVTLCGRADFGKPRSIEHAAGSVCLRATAPLLTRPPYETTPILRSQSDQTGPLDASRASRRTLPPAGHRAGSPANARERPSI